jgi:hypothetical protein
MDGRVQLPVIQFLKERFNANYVDMITEPGPNLILSKQTEKDKINSIINRVEISLKKHHSKGIAIVGHHDCAGNPAEKDHQVSHIQKSIKFFKKQYRDIEIIGLWIDADWRVSEIKQLI